MRDKSKDVSKAQLSRSQAFGQHVESLKEKELEFLGKKDARLVKTTHDWETEYSASSEFGGMLRRGVNRVLAVGILATATALAITFIPEKEKEIIKSPAQYVQEARVSELSAVQLIENKDRLFPNDIGSSGVVGRNTLERVHFTHYNQAEGYAAVIGEIDDRLKDLRSFAYQNGLEMNEHDQVSLLEAAALYDEKNGLNIALDDSEVNVIVSFVEQVSDLPRYEKTHSELADDAVNAIYARPSN